MKNETLQQIQAYIDKCVSFEHIKTADIPNIDLYMDQVTTFMDSHLGFTRRNPDDKVLTKTMINNYAKNDLLPPPEKKKYSKQHMLFLIFIYYFKNVISITDTQTLLKQITEHHFAADSALSLEAIYNEVFTQEDQQRDILNRDLQEMLETASKTFQDADEDEQEFLQLFAFICTLSYDVYMKKNLIEHLIDSITPAQKNAEDKKKSDKESKK